MSALAQAFLQFARIECPHDACYVAICHAVAESPELLGLMLHAPATQRRPNLFLASVHDLLLREPAHPLAVYFQSLGGACAPDAQLGVRLKDLVAQHPSEMVALLSQRHTQTNEIGRCAVLWPVLQREAVVQGGRPLALLDLGCSAGLNLGVDRYRYNYQSDRGAFSRGGPYQPEQAQVACVWQGCAPPPDVAVPLHAKLGLDVQPVNVQDPQAVRWLQACVWPGDVARMERLRQAVAQARLAGDTVRRMEGLVDLQRWLDSLPADVVPVLFNSWVLSYFEQEQLAQLRVAAQSWMLQRGLVWISAEAPALRPPGLSCPDWPAHRPMAGQTLWTRQAAVNGVLHAEALAWSHPHGHWLHCLSPGHQAVRQDLG